MAYQQSPGVEIVEKDASAITVGLSSTVGAHVGAYRWGPVMTPMLMSNESQLATTFGKPADITDDNASASWPAFFAAANFLSYTNSCWVTRVIGHTVSAPDVDGNVTRTTTAKNASSSGTGILISNHVDYETLLESESAPRTTAGMWAARYPGTLGSGLIVSMADSATFTTWQYAKYFSAAPSTSRFATKKNCLNDELHIVVVDGSGKFGEMGAILEKYEFVSKASDALTYQGTNNYYAQVISNKSSYIYWINHPATTDLTTVGTAGWGVPAADQTFKSLVNISNVTATSAGWAANVVTIAFPANVTDATKVPFAVGEKITVAGFTPTDYNGTYTVTACTATSVTYAKTLGADPGAGGAGTVTSADMPYDFTQRCTGGADGIEVTDGDREIGWDIFADTQTYDISLLIAGNASIGLSRYIVQNVADVRKDCVAFTSITKTDSTGLAVQIPNNDLDKTASAIAFKTFESTYAVIDSGYKYMYDKYNDVYRWVALNADTAGLCARVDVTNDPWHSPAGMVKGQVKNVTKLSWNPNKAERDKIYPAAINPVINLVGQGTLLFGDRTATSKPSAFDKINVRRLFLVLEKSIASSAKYQLFELNDEITRLQFVSSVEPFLRNVKGRRGIDDFRVICDESNNTPQVVASNNFVGSILIKPKYSINYITLNFTAVGPDVTFEQAALI